MRLKCQSDSLGNWLKALNIMLTVGTEALVLRNGGVKTTGKQQKDAMSTFTQKSKYPVKNLSES